MEKGAPSISNLETCFALNIASAKYGLIYFGFRWVTNSTLISYASAAAGLTGSAVVILVGLALTSVPFVQPLFLLNYAAHPIGYIFPVLNIATLLSALVIRRRNLDAGTFFATSLLILTMLASAAWGSYPNILISTNDPANSLTVTNATAGVYGLQIGLWWFLIGIILLIAYQACAHQAFRGKVTLGAH